MRTFTVPASPDETWRALLDVPRVASALPGATVERGEGGEHRGRLKLKLGPVALEYAGTARLEDVDEDARAATFYVQGSGGQGSASATIHTRVEPVDGGGSRVTVDTDLRVTGRAATFGRGLMEDVAGRMLGEFAKRLESVISQPAESEPARERLRDVSPSPSPAPAVRLRAPGWAVSFLAGVVVGMLLRRRPDVVVIRER